MNNNHLENSNSLDNLTAIEIERNNIITLNNDRVYGVYELVSNQEDNLDVTLINNAVTCYPNQLQNLK
jgi:hypothetical protein